MTMTKAISVIAILACFINNCDAKITKWTTPIIATANGVGTIKNPILESTTVNTEVVTLVAVSNVSSPNITYCFVQPSPVFKISGKGAISVSAKLDYETKKIYEIKVKAADQENEGTATVTLSIGNVTPDFLETSYSACVEDGVVINKTVTSVKAGDVKSTGVTYSIEDGNAKGDFDINTKGEIITAKKIDKSKVSSYKLTVKSAAGGDTAEVNIKVGDCSAASLTSTFSIFAIMCAVMLALN